MTRKYHNFFRLATNSMTKPIPAMIIPELKLFAATMAANGSTTIAIRAIPAGRSTSLPSFTKSAATETMIVILTSSVG
jgi:hypothetical protein